MRSTVMRDCVFLVADKNMEAAFQGFLEREQFHRSMGCGLFEFDAGSDLLVGAGQNDPGLYTRGHELLRSYQRSHRHAVIVLDEAWDGSPGAAKIEAKVRRDLEESGWERERVEVIVICPELEVWVCHDSPQVEQVLGCQKAGISLKESLVTAGFWQADRPKPDDPKSGIERVLRQVRMPRSSALFKKITSEISVKRCVDPAFERLRDALQRWFPVEEGAI
jgi:hypothetical protein